MKDPRIIRAFDTLEPSEEAKARMLANILEGAEGSKGPETAKANPVAPKALRPQRKKRRFGLLGLGAAAASLALVAGIGLFAAGGVGADLKAFESQGADMAAPEDNMAYDSIGYVTAPGGAPESSEMEMMADSLAGFDTEEYAALREHGFTSVASQPFSTFSADVDTASYTNWRRMVNQGYALGEFPHGAIRVEEFLNYFDYAYPFEDCDCLSPFRETLSISDCPWNPETKLMILGLRTADASWSDTAKGNNLVFLIDVSGSMDDPAKLGLLKDSFAYLIEQLNPDDTVSIVTYAGDERVVLEGVSAERKGRILEAVDSLGAYGSTNGQAGLAKAYELAERYFIEGGNNRIVLASDGDLNVGMTSESELSDYVSEKREGGVYLTVLGFGDGNYSDVRMETLADDGNGNYFYIDCMDEARRVFGKELCSTMVTVADDVKLQIEFNPAYVKGYRQVGYENRALATDEFRDDRVDAGEVGAGHCVTVAYELVMADSDMDLPSTDSRYSTSQAGLENGEWFALNVRWKNPGSSEANESSSAFGGECYTQNPSADWLFASAVIEYCMLATDSDHKGNASVMRVLDKVDASLALADDPYRREFRSLVSNSTE